MRALAVDLGTVRIGLALTDPAKMIASPFDTLLAGDSDAQDWPQHMAVRIAAIAREQQADTIVVGLPRGLSGRDTASTTAARLVIAALPAVTDATVEAFDERFSTVEAERALIGAGTRRDARRAARDRVAAAIILRAWLEARAARAARPVTDS